MTFDDLERKITRNVEKIVSKHAQTFHADIVSAWAVDQTKPYLGIHSKLLWNISKKGTAWVVTNNANYSGILFMGRVGNRGSNQLPAGGYPILKANTLRLKADLKRNTL